MEKKISKTTCLSKLEKKYINLLQKNGKQHKTLNIYNNINKKLDTTIINLIWNYNTKFNLNVTYSLGTKLFYIKPLTTKKLISQFFVELRKLLKKNKNNKTIYYITKELNTLFNSSGQLYTTQVTKIKKAISLRALI